MSERIKITTNDFALGSWTDANWIIPFGNFSSESYDLIPQQILDDQEKVEKYDDLMKANSEIIQNNISHTQIYQENKQLKEQLGNLSSRLSTRALEHSKSLQKLENIKDSLTDEREGDCYKVGKIKKILAE